MGARSATLLNEASSRRKTRSLDRRATAVLFPTETLLSGESPAPVPYRQCPFEDTGRG